MRKGWKSQDCSAWRRLRAGAWSLWVNTWKDGIMNAELFQWRAVAGQEATSTNWTQEAPSGFQGAPFTVRMEEHRHGLPWASMIPPSLEIFKRHLDMDLGNQLCLSQGGWVTQTSRCPSEPLSFCNSQNYCLVQGHTSILSSSKLPSSLRVQLCTTLQLGVHQYSQSHSASQAPQSCMSLVNSASGTYPILPWAD